MQEEKVKEILSKNLAYDRALHGSVSAPEERALPAVAPKAPFKPQVPVAPAPEGRYRRKKHVRSASPAGAGEAPRGPGREEGREEEGSGPMEELARLLERDRALLEAVEQPPGAEILVVQLPPRTSEPGPRPPLPPDEGGYADEHFEEGGAGEAAGDEGGLERAERAEAAAVEAVAHAEEMLRLLPPPPADPAAREARQRRHRYADAEEEEEGGGQEPAPQPWPDEGGPAAPSPPPADPAPPPAGPQEARPEPPPAEPGAAGEPGEPAAEGGPEGAPPPPRPPPPPRLPKEEEVRPLEEAEAAWVCPKYAPPPDAEAGDVEALLQSDPLGGARAALRLTPTALKANPTPEELEGYAVYFKLPQRWFPPQVEMSVVLAAAFTCPVPHPWRELATGDGRVYYHDRVANVTSWTHPLDPLYKAYAAAVVEALDVRQAAYEDMLRVSEEALRRTRRSTRAVLALERRARSIQGAVS